MAIITTTVLDDSIIQRIYNSPSRAALEPIDADVLFSNFNNLRVGHNNLVTQTAALEAGVVLLTTNQDVGGVKTFLDGIAFTSPKGITQSLLAIGATLAAGDRELRFHRNAAGSSYANLFFTESSATFSFYTTGTTLAKILHADGSTATHGMTYGQGVKATGSVTETITGIKTASGQWDFIVGPICSVAPATGPSLTNRTYVDLQVFGNMGITQSGTAPAATLGALWINTTTKTFNRGNGTTFDEIGSGGGFSRTFQHMGA